MASKQDGLYRARGLTSLELVEIDDLASICNHNEGLELKLNRSILQQRPADEINDFLYYEQGQLVGFLALFHFHAREAEISGMVHPEARRKGVFTALFNAARAECQRRNVAEILCIVEHASLSGTAFVHHLGVRYHHSEYRMVLQVMTLPATWDERLQFRHALPDDATMLARITAISFDVAEADVDWYTAESISDTDHSYYVGLVDDQVIGKLDVHYSDQGAFILGFGVLPAYRGRGYGRQILARTLREIAATGERRIALEVATGNKGALSLYQSLGFSETGSYDYYSFLQIGE